MMERLTFEGNFCEIAQCACMKCPYDTDCSQKQVWERLKAYEDTGLSPIACEESAKIEKGLSEGGFSTSRMVELMCADKEGRVIVLPCKVGDTIWRLKRTFETYPDKSKPYTEADGFLLQDIWNVGKNVFLTREEAEKALAEMEGKG
jgi:hypothetical protein